MTRQQMENYVFGEFVKAIEAKNGPMNAEDRYNMQSAIEVASDQDLADTVADIRRACRKNGVMMLDDEGNPMQGC